MTVGPDGQPVSAGTGGEITQRYAAQQAAKQTNGNVPAFKDAASVDAAKAAGTLKTGDTIQVNGRMAVVK